MMLCCRATNAENGELNKIKNRVTGEWGAVCDVARAYKKVHLTYNTCILESKPMHP